MAQRAARRGFELVVGPFRVRHAQAGHPQLDTCCIKRGNGLELDRMNGFVHGESIGLSRRAGLRPAAPTSMKAEPLVAVFAQPGHQLHFAAFGALLGGVLSAGPGVGLATARDRHNIGVVAGEIDIGVDLEVQRGACFP